MRSYAHNSIRRRGCLSLASPTDASAFFGLLVAAFAVMLTCTVGCDREPVGAKSTDSVSRSAAKGPVSLTLTANPESVDWAQVATVTLEVVAEKGVNVFAADYDQVSGEGDHRFEYRIRRTDSRASEPTNDGKLRWTYAYEVEFFLPGEHELPPAEISFAEILAEPNVEDEDSDTPAEIQTVSTEPLTITVRPPAGSPLTEDQMRSITTLDPVDLPRRWHNWWWTLPLAALVVLVAIVLLVRSRRRRLQSVVEIPAHEWARSQIAALIAADLLAKGLVQEFHYRISAIVRGYIERRFGVSAPEMTTEEFLTAVAKDGRFGESVAVELGRFLTACDLVKYARHEPRSGESEAVLRAASDFVDRTRRTETTDDGNAADSAPVKECAA